MVQQGMVALLRGGASRRWQRYPQRGALLPPMYTLYRAFSSKLFVGGLSYRTDEEMLRKAFAEHGEVSEVRIITDRETGRSRGFGFVSFSLESEAEAAKSKMSNHLLDGRLIRVDMASNRPPPSAARPFGNSESFSSPSGFSFGSVGSRPPVVEDWGPLPSYSAQVSQNTSTAQSNNPAYQGGMDTFNGGGQSINSNNQGGRDAFSEGQNNTTVDVYNGAHQANISCDPKPFDSNTFGSTSFSSGAASSSATFGAPLSSSRSTSAFQSSTITSDFQSSTFGATAFDSSTFGTAVSATTTQSTVTSNSMGLPVMSSSTAPQAGGSGSGSGLGLGNISSLGDCSQPGIGLGQEQGFSSIDSPQAGRSGLELGLGQSSAPSNSSQAGGPGSGQASSFRDTAQSDGSGLGLVQGSNVSVAAEADIIEFSGAKLPLGSTDGSSVSSPSTSLPSDSSEDYDFRNFPALNSSSYQDYKLPSELKPPKRRGVSQSSSKVSTFQSKLTVESIPPPKGRPYDFGLGHIPSSPPPLGVGAGFDINISLDDLKEASSARPPGYSIFSQRTLPPLDLPWDTPEADNWSEIGEEPRRIEDSIYSPFSSDLKNDPEFWWDPYDFDAEAKLPREPEAEEPSAANAAV